MGLVVADLSEHLIAVGNDRRALVGPDRRDGVDHIRDHAGVVDDDLPGLLGPEIGKLLQHLIGGVQIEGRGVLVGHAHALLDDGPVDLVLRVHEVDIPSGYDRLAGLRAQADDGPVEVQQILFRPDLGVFVLHLRGLQKEAVVVPWLDLQIVIEIHDARQDLIRPLL